MSFSHLILCFVALVLIVGGSAMAGPFSDAYTGVSYDTNLFSGWIVGYVSVDRPVPGSGGYAKDNLAQDTSISNAIIGKPSDFSMNGTTRHVYSLGNGGSITLTFDAPIGDGPGPDFAVFENGFEDAERPPDGIPYIFAELAFVEVGTTTNAWARFPVTYLAGTDHYLYEMSNAASNRYASLDSSQVDGVAGKHVIEYGTPFDLTDLSALPSVTNGSVDLEDIHYIRLVDIVGDGSAHDGEERPIFDPYFSISEGYPHPGAISINNGFDLRAVGVLNFALRAGLDHAEPGSTLSWFGGQDQTYQPQWTATPASPEWHDLGDPVTGHLETIAVTDTNRTDALRIYRIVRK